MNEQSPINSRLSPCLSKVPSKGAQLAHYIEENTQDRHNPATKQQVLENYQSITGTQQWSNQAIINNEEIYQGDETPLQGSVIQRRKKNTKNQRSAHHEDLDDQRVINAIKTPQGMSDLVLNEGGVYGVETERHYQSHGKQSNKNSEKPKLYETLKQAKRPRPNLPSSQQAQAPNRAFKIQSNAKPKQGIKLNEGYKQALKILHQIQHNERVNQNFNNLQVPVESRVEANQIMQSSGSKQMSKKKSIKSLQNFQVDSANRVNMGN